MLSQGDLNALGLRALGRRVAAAFPSVWSAVLALEVGDYADHAAPGVFCPPPPPPPSPTPMITCSPRPRPLCPPVQP